MEEDHAPGTKSDLVSQENVLPEKCHASGNNVIDTSIGLDMFAPTVPTPLATKFSPLKTPPADKLSSSPEDLPQPKALTYSSNNEQTLELNTKLESGEPLIGAPATAESVNDSDVPPGGGRSYPSDQFYGDPASVEDLWEFAQEILHDDFSPNNAPRSMRSGVPQIHRSSLPSHVKRSILAHFRTNVLLPLQSFRPLPTSRVGQSSPGSYCGLEQRLVEGRHGVLHRNCPIWTKHRINQHQKAQRSTLHYEFVATYKCKCVGCRYELSVIRVDGGLVFMQKTELRNGKKHPVFHDMDRHNACPSLGHKGSRSSLSHAQKEYIAMNGLSKKKLDAFAAEMLHGDVVVSSEEQRQDPSRFKNSVRQFIHRNPQFCVDRKRHPMKMDVILELLDLLKTNPLERDCDAPVGRSHNWYYYTEGWKHYVWKSLWVSSHDYSKDSGSFTSILLHPLDVVERSRMIAHTFPGNCVQLELDYLFPKRVDAHWVLGHSGASCYAHTYWWLTIQVASSESEPTGTLLADSAVSMIEDNTQGRVTNFLQDGGTAIMAAVKNVSDAKVRKKSR